MIHLAGTLRLRRGDTFRAANVESTRRVLDAADGATPERVIYLSYPAADPTARNPYLRSKGEAEELLRSSDVPYTIFRCPHVYGTPEDPGPTALENSARRGASVLVLGDGQQRVAPVFKEDVVGAILKGALDRSAPCGIFDLAGPETMTFDEFVRRINGEGVRLVHVPSALVPAIGRLRRHLTPAMAEVMAADSAPRDRPERARSAFGISLTAVGEIWG